MAQAVATGGAVFKNPFLLVATMHIPDLMTNHSPLSNNHSYTQNRVFITAL